MRTLKITLAMLMIILAYSCENDDAMELQTEFTGNKISIGNGEAWSYVQTDEMGTPLAIGVQFTESSLDGLPEGEMFPPEYVLDLPEGISVAPFDHITMDWNEHGHEPMHVYDLPHFDFHFYFMSEQQRNAIGPNDSIEFNKPMLAEYLPALYLETPGGVPRMGAHIIDLMSPEIAGTGIFTHTFIYGKYDAKLNFLEPMVTTDFLRSKAAVRKSIRQPELWQKSGYYPQEYTIDYESSTGVYTVRLDGLVKK